jgi:hypothetical protein
MFVPSLSWQMIGFHQKLAQQRRFSHHIRAQRCLSPQALSAVDRAYSAEDHPTGYVKRRHRAEEWEPRARPPPVQPRNSVFSCMVSGCVFYSICVQLELQSSRECPLAYTSTKVVILCCASLVDVWCYTHIPIYNSTTVVGRKVRTVGTASQPRGSEYQSCLRSYYQRTSILPRPCHRLPDSFAQTETGRQFDFYVTGQTNEQDTNDQIICLEALIG